MQIGAGAARLLGQREVREDGLVLELVHELGLELRLAVVVEDAPVQVGGVVQVHAHAARSAGELLLHLQDLLLGQAPSTVLLGQRVAVQVVLDGQVVEFLRELVGDLHLLLHLLERTLGERTHRLEVLAELLWGKLAHTSSFNVLPDCRFRAASPSCRRVATALASVCTLNEYFVQ